MEKTESLVRLIFGTQDQYNNSDSSNNDAYLFFITDTHKIYKGQNLIANYIDASVLENMQEQIDTIQNDISTFKRFVLTAE